MTTTVLCFGTYDKFHPGHQWFLTEAKKLGNKLVVVIGRDQNVLKLKGHLPTQNEQERLAQVQQFSAVDEAMLGMEDFSRREEMIAKINPQIICLGYDQAPNFKSPSPNIQVVRLNSFQPEIYKSSKL